MSGVTAERLGSSTAALLAQVRSLPLLRLEEAGAVTTVTTNGRTIALVDGARQCAEIAASVFDRDQMLREYPAAEPGSIGITLQLTSSSRVQSAVALIRRGLDEARYHWQRTSANP